MASRIRDERAASQTKLSGSSQVQSAYKGQKLAEDSSSSSSGSDDDSSDGSDGSGSGSDIEAARKKYTAQQANKRKSTKAKEAVVESKPSTKSTLNTIIPASSQASTKPTNIKHDASDSSSESESEYDTASQNSGPSNSPATNAVKEGGKAEREVESESSSEGSSESESEEEEGASAKRPAEAESSSDGASESDSSDPSEESGDEANRMEVDGGETAVSRVNGNTGAHDSTSEVSRPAWLNNSNFVLRKASSDNPAKEVTEFFSKANLEGKQVWYFTAPASLPITVLKDMQIDLSKAATGEALLNHKGDEYGLDLEANATSTQIQLLIPSQAGDNYTALNRGIDSTVHVRHIAKFGPGSTTSATATKDYIPIPKAIREQPQGLKPRFTPIGVPNPIPPPILPTKLNPTPVAQNTSSSESESESESDGDMAASQPRLATSSASSKKPKKSDAVNGKLKRKHPSDEGSQTTPVRESQSQEKAAKRPKTAKSTPKASGSKKGAATQTAAISTPSETPSKVASSKKVKASKDKPKYAIRPSKQTPIPPPIFPSMNR